MARGGRRGAAVAALVRPARRRARGPYGSGDWRTRVRVGGPRLVAVLQPGALGRAAGRHRADGRLGGRDKARRSPVHCGRNDGDDAAHLIHPRPEPRPRRRGGGGPSRGPRRAPMFAAILLACAAFPLIRTGGMSGEGISDLHWRWTPTPEQRLLAQAANEPAPLPPPPAAAPAPDTRLPTKTGDQPTVPT